MNYSVIIRPEAEVDLVETFSWYEDKRQGLGYDFLLQVEAGVKVLERTTVIHIEIIIFLTAISAAIRKRIKV